MPETAHGSRGFLGALSGILGVDAEPSPGARNRTLLGYHQMSEDRPYAPSASRSELPRSGAHFATLVPTASSTACLSGGKGAGGGATASAVSALVQTSRLAR